MVPGGISHFGLMFGLELARDGIIATRKYTLQIRAHLAPKNQRTRSSQVGRARARDCGLQEEERRPGGVRTAVACDAAAKDDELDIDGR